VRFDDFMLGRLKELADRRNVGYQTLLKEFVAERLYEEEKREGILAGEKYAVSRILDSENERRREMKRRRRPRHFQYLDVAMAESYLSQLKGGIPEGGSSTERFSNSERRDRGLRYKGTGVGRERGTEESSEDQESVRYNPETIFSRLYEELDRETEEEEKILAHLDSLDEDDWNELSDGDIVEITGTIKIPEILKAMDIASKFEQMLPFLDQIGEWAGEGTPFGQKERALLSGLGGFKEAIGSQDATVVVIELVKTPQYRFVAKLKKDYLHPDAGELEGEAKVVGTIGRKVNKGDPPIGFEQLVPGLEALRGVQDLSSRPINRAERRAKGNRGQPQHDDSTSIGYPAATLTPIGIYR
jgi:hypothetical protein